MTTKIDIINAAYSRLRISGLTVQPTPEDISVALEKLEDMAQKWLSLNIDTGYFFEDAPDPNTPHNVPRKYWAAYKSNLAVLLAPDFGVDAKPSLITEARATYGIMSARTALQKQVPYPSRQPVGSGNSIRANMFQRFYNPVAEAPQSSDTVTMYVGDINDFYFDFSAYLVASESIQSYVLTSDDGLVITADSLSSPRVDYTIRADGTNGELVTDDFLQVKIVVTFTSGRKLTKFRDFRLLNADLTS